MRLDSSNSLALVVYDCLLTFGSEVVFFWKPRRPSGAMILFLLNRYLTLGLQIYNCVPEPRSFQVRCLMSRRLHIYQAEIDPEVRTSS